MFDGDARNCDEANQLQGVDIVLIQIIPDCIRSVFAMDRYFCCYVFSSKNAEDRSCNQNISQK